MRIRVLSGFAALTLAAGAASILPASAATAAPAQPTGKVALTAPASGTRPGQNVSAVVAPSWQTNGTVWAIAYARGIVYVGGGFTSVRPPGAKPGQGEVARSYLAAFNAKTGALITSFNPAITGVPACTSNLPCGVTALATSPRGGVLYVGGDFNHVNGSFRNFTAAFNTVTGALSTTWKPAATGSVHAIAPSPDGKNVYLGGDFTMLDGQPRNRVGEVSALDGSVLAWAPQVNGTITSIAVAPDETRVLIGGDFTTVNGNPQNAIDSTDPVTGNPATWVLPATFVPDNPPGCAAQVKDIIISGTTAYIASEGTGAGCFDGDFAVNVSDGRLVWQNDCLGATQALVIINKWLYKGSHAHDCAYSPGGFPQVKNPVGHGYIIHRLLTQSLKDGSLGHWTPNTNGNQLGPRAMATDGTRLFLGGDFTTVNGRPQEGFARFTPTPDVTGPKRPAAPTAISTSKGVDSVTFTAVSDADDGTLKYAIYRDGGRRPIAILKAQSWPWALPVLRYRDTRLKPGSKHTYQVTASDGIHTSARSPASAPVRVAKGSPKLSYFQVVLADHPSFFWRLNEKSGTTAGDLSGHGFKGIYEPGTKQGVPGPITGNRTTATAFNGQTGLVTSATAVTAPQVFSVECWFKTGTNTGGKLIGFGDTQTGQSVTNFDRNIYMMNDGQLVFGVNNGAIQAIETPRVYNDRRWHYVVGTMGPLGLALYVDGQLIGTSPTKSAFSYTGYWRVGGDNLNGGWNLDFWKTNSQGTTQPYDFYFGGTIGDVAVYPVALSAKQVAAHYAANALSH